MAQPALNCNFSTTAALVAGIVNVDVPIGNATNWEIILSNTGASNITVLTIATSPTGALFEGANSITAGIPLAAGKTLSGIRGFGEPVAIARLAITSDGVGSVAVQAGGL